MNNRFKVLITGLFLLAGISQVNAEYTETMNENGLQENLRSDYKVSGSGSGGDDSAVFQQAIDDVAGRGGGRVYVPKGVYRVRGIQLRSGVHLLVDHEAVIEPYITGDEKKATMFSMGVGTGPIQNASIRGTGGPFTVQILNSLTGITVVRCGHVKNFLLSNIRIDDHKSPYSSLAFQPSGRDKKMEGFPEDGTIENCSVYDAHYGYGLVQTQAGKNLLFKNLYAEGGVALRMETGSNRMNDLQFGGVDQIVGKNMRAKNGHCAVMVGPHSMHNGKIMIDGVWSESCNFAVKIGSGRVNGHQKNADLTSGTFGAGSYIKNIHAVYGVNAQHKSKDWRMLTPELQHQLVLNAESKNITRGASVSAVLNEALYPIDVINVSVEGFSEVPAVISGQMREDLMKKYKTSIE